MKRKIYWKDILRSFTSSKGRFLSILILMMLGSLALVGLKVAPPNMRRTATDYLKEQRTMDLAIMADYGSLLFQVIGCCFAHIWRSDLEPYES